MEDFRPVDTEKNAFHHGDKSLLKSFPVIAYYNMFHAFINLLHFPFESTLASEKISIDTLLEETRPVVTA